MTPLGWAGLWGTAKEWGGAIESFDVSWIWLSLLYCLQLIIPISMLCVVSLCCFSLFFVVLFPDLCPSKGALPDMEEQAAPTTDASGSLWDFAVDPNVVGSSGEGGAARNMSTWSTLIPSGIPWNSMFFGTEGHDRHMAYEAWHHGTMARQFCPQNCLLPFGRCFIKKP